MSTISIRFRGICTHLIPRHDVIGAPSFRLFTGSTEIAHRVVLANSAYIPSHIDPDRCVVEHVPMLRIGDNDIPLKDVAVAFENLDKQKGSDDHYADLLALPHLWEKSFGNIHPRPAVLNGWTRLAGAYVDFTGGVKFSPGLLDELLAELYFNGDPAIVFRPFNGDKNVTSFALQPGAQIEISNLPAGTACGNSDYLLHYFVTTRDVSKDAPVWTPAVTLEEKLDVLERRKPAHEVYCSSSTYP